MSRRKILKSHGQTTQVNITTLLRKMILTQPTHSPGARTNSIDSSVSRDSSWESVAAETKWKIFSAGENARKQVNKNISMLYGAQLSKLMRSNNLVNLQSYYYTTKFTKATKAYNSRVHLILHWFPLATTTVTLVEQQLVAIIQNVTPQEFHLSAKLTTMTENMLKLTNRAGI